MDSMPSNSDHIHPGPTEPTPTLLQGEYGLLAWLANQAFQRRCATGNDFVFLCAEALLRPLVLESSRSLKALRYHTDETDIDTDWVSASRLRNKMNLMTCRDVIETLPSWIDGLCLNVTNNGQVETRARILRQYEQKIKSKERELDLSKHKLDLAFAKIGGKMALESISETKSSKICMVGLVL